MTTSKRQSHVHEREFWGEAEAHGLIEWLDRANRPSGDPVEKLVRLASGSPDPLRNMPREIERTVSRLVRRAQFAMAPSVSVAVDGWSVSWKLVGSMNPSQGRAFLSLLHLAEKGLLDRVRKCAWRECGLWFFGRFSHQLFHSGRCQQRAARSTEEWKAGRRAYMKRLRREQKQRDQHLELKRKGARR